MVKRAVNIYAESFKGLSNEIWWLALITFINRAGTMVLPFLSLYLTEDLNLTLSQVGWVMSAFGVGSLAGSWLGGKLTDKVGFYKVMFWSLLSTGFLFLMLQYINSFMGFTIGIFFTMLIADTFRPAMFVSLKVYSKLENRTRSLTLIRMAINLGFSFGPFLGGIIISTLGYGGLFWVDGLTCIAAVFLMKAVLSPKKMNSKNIEVVQVEEVEENPKSVFKDYSYVIFLTVVFLMGFIFLQLFTTMPLYYKDVHGLTELQIGLIMSLNGFIIFLLEMPLIHYIEKTLWDKMKVISWSLFLMALSFLVLNISGWIGVLIIGMLFITVGEMLAFPFTNSFAMSRAPKGRDGMYLAYYTMAFSFAHIFSAKTGMEIIDRFGFNANWYLMGSLGFVAILLMFVLRNMLLSNK
ncbi:MDR family MFS transporter [Lutibacter citreus]|uniref:MDR family MFS transporter n=1 Tax=Lutibacter citreus TaxID=2138210 RepID=UPI000DBE6744|nr:MFS transporter [Lutibacter citreus]